MTADDQAIAQAETFIRAWNHMGRRIVQPDGTTWARSYEDGVRYLEHRDGVVWTDAPLHRKRQPHRAQTRGFMGHYVERCSCGAFGPAPWFFHDKPRYSSPRRNLFARLLGASAVKDRK